MEDDAEYARLLEAGALDGRDKQSGQGEIGDDHAESDGKELVGLHISRGCEVYEHEADDNHQHFARADCRQAGGTEEVQ